MCMMNQNGAIISDNMGQRLMLENEVLMTSIRAIAGELNGH